MPRTKKPDMFQLAVATRSYSSVDGYRKEIDVLKNELAQTRQRLDDQAETLRGARVYKAAAREEALLRRGRVVVKDDTKWEALAAAPIHRRGAAARVLDNGARANTHQRSRLK